MAASDLDGSEAKWTHWDRDEEAYSVVAQRAQELFLRKNRDYGGSWRTMRLTSLLDRMYTKLQRIEALEMQEAVVPESQQDSALDLVNEAIFVYLCLLLRDGDMTLGPDALADDRQRFLTRVTALVRAGHASLAAALEMVNAYDHAHPGAEAAWNAEYALDGAQVLPEKTARRAGDDDEDEPDDDNEPPAQRLWHDVDPFKRTGEREFGRTYERG